MTPFVEATTPPEFHDPRLYMQRFGYSYEAAVRAAEQMKTERYYLNDLYQVHVSDVHRGLGWPDFIHLSIKRIDKGPVRDWRHMQIIKNTFVGEENEGMEIYPAESRMVDMANQYHLWVFVDPSVRIPMGWQTRMVATPEQAESVGAKQRSFEEVA